MSDRIWSDMGDGARDVVGHAITDIGHHYHQIHTGRPAPMTSMPGVMESTTETDPQIGPPESMTQALLKHGAAEGVEKEAEHWRDYAERAGSIDTSDIQPGVTGWERYSAMRDGMAAQGSGQGFYGVGPADASASTPEQEDDHAPEI